MALTPEQIKQLRDYYADLEMDTSTIEKNLEEAAKNQKFLTEQSKLAAQHFDEAAISAGGIASSLQDAVQELSKGNSFTKSALGSFKSLQSVASKFKYDMSGYSTMSKKEIERNITKIQQERDNLKLLIAKKRITGEAAAEAQNVINQSYTLEEIAKERLAEEIKIQRQMGLTGAIVDGVVGTLSKLGISSVFFDGIKEDMRDAAKSGGSLKAMFTGIVGLGKGIADAFTDPLTILTFIINAGLKADKQTTELAKSLGIGKDQANGLRNNFAKYATSTGDAFITTSKLLEAQGELTNELGVAVQYTGKQTEDFTRLTKLMGLSASEAGKLARLSIISGTSIEATTKSIIKGSAASQRANKIAIDQRTILKDVANLSAGILVKFQGNPEALGAAVVQARALGLNLEEVDKIGESLLNWESSIENELKAELITGKQLNLERARAAALTGDQATLMQEVSSQMGSLEDFQNMNIIAQKSLAEAFGLSRDEVSKMLLEQEKVNKLGDVSKMTLDQQLEALKAQGEPLDSVLYKQIQQQSAQEKFNNAVEKLQDIIGNLVAGPVGQLIDAFASILSSATGLYTIIGLIGTVSLVKMIASLTTALALKKLSTRESIKGATADAAGAAGNAAGSAAKIPGIGWLIAGGIAATLFGALIGYLAGAKTGDDVISPGYGKRMMFGPEGAVSFNDKDTIVAGTDLNKEGIQNSSVAGNSIDISPLVSAINEVRNAVNALANKPQPAMALHVGAEKLGEVVGRQAETGTNQYQNAYRLA
jgi:hypothetical protein